MMPLSPHTLNTSRSSRRRRKCRFHCSLKLNREKLHSTNKQKYQCSSKEEHTRNHKQTKIPMQFKRIPPPPISPVHKKPNSITNDHATGMGKKPIPVTEIVHNKRRGDNSSTPCALHTTHTKEPTRRLTNANDSKT